MLRDARGASTARQLRDVDRPNRKAEKEKRAKKRQKKGGQALNQHILFDRTERCRSGARKPPFLNTGP